MKTETQNLTASQTQKIESLKNIIEENISENNRERYGAKITVVRIDETTYGTVWLKVETELTALPETSLLRILDHDHWMISIGRKGAAVAEMVPDYLRQLAGSKWNGIKISKDVDPYGFRKTNKAGENFRFTKWVNEAKAKKVFVDLQDAGVSVLAALKITKTKCEFHVES